MKLFLSTESITLGNVQINGGVSFWQESLINKKMPALASIFGNK